MCLFQLWFSQGICLVVGLLGHMVVLWYHMTIKPYGRMVELDTTEQLNNGSFIPNFLSNLHTVLHSVCINLHSHQQCKTIPFSPHPPQHWFVDFLMVGILCIDLVSCDTEFAD